MPSTFGARLREHREEHGISLRAISEQTKIKMSLLDALERDDLSHWPSGIFRRAYVRAYAAAIGLRPDTVLGEFLDVYPEPVDPADLPAGADGARANGGGMPMRLRDVMGSAMVSLSRLRRAAIADDRHRSVAQPAPPPAVLPEAGRPPEPLHDLFEGDPGAVWPDFQEEHYPEPAGNAQAGDLKREHHAEPEPEPQPEAQLDPPPVSQPEPQLDPPPESQPEPQLEPEPESQPAPRLDLLAAANVCTALGQAENASEVQALLGDASRILGARGLIVWVWDDPSAELRPALAYGYPESLLAQLPGVTADADNLTAAAFRSCEGMAVHGSDHASGALVVPLLTPAACAGVLAIELPNGAEDSASVWAVATFFAAMLAQLFGGAANV